MVVSTNSNPIGCSADRWFFRLSPTRHGSSKGRVRIIATVCSGSSPSPSSENFFHSHSIACLLRFPVEVSASVHSSAIVIPISTFLDVLVKDMVSKSRKRVDSLRNDTVSAELQEPVNAGSQRLSASPGKSLDCNVGVKSGRKSAKTPTEEDSVQISTQRRRSSRVCKNSKEEKELLVLRRVELLDDPRGGTGKRKTREHKRRCDSENGSDGDSKVNEKATPEVDGGGKTTDLGAGVENRIVCNGCVPLAGKSDNAKVKEAIRLFNKHYLHFVQEEEKRCQKAEADKKAAKGSKNGASAEYTKNTAKRPDLKAISKMMKEKEILNQEKRIGDIPGIIVGHQFYSRAEMVAVGFHSHWLNGIDYMGISYSKVYSEYSFPLAVAIVLSGAYEDDLDNAEDVVYTGQGGHNLTGNKRQIRDQVMERGNLALKNCVEQCVPVRVVRGHGCTSSYCGKVYTYDGLYKVVQHWAEKGLSGFTVLKYRLRRLEGQPLLTTNQVQFIYGRIPQSLSEIRGLVCEDITKGQENVPIPATNLVDDPAMAPTGYTYCKSIKVAPNVKLPANGNGCNCKGTCVDAKTCACATLNGGEFPYVHRDGGRLIEAKDVVFECGPKCGCGPGCVNRTSQRGIKHRLEVFRTPKKGWAVRSWDFIPSGAPVCEYTGILMKTEDLDHVTENSYIFDIDCLQTMRGIGGRERRLGDVVLPVVNTWSRMEDQRLEQGPEFGIDACSTGNIARFINHSCEPNLFVQCVLSSHHDIKLPRVMLFAAENIPPLQELTYDYGYVHDSVHGPDGKIQQMPCYCGAADCRKRLF